MSGGIRTFKLANGGYADVPEDSMDEWMRRMDRRGIKFSTADVQPDMQVGEPTAIKGGLPDWGEDEDAGFMERFASGGARKPAAPPEDDGILATAGDALWSGAQGVMHGWGDEFAGLRGDEYQQAARDRLALAKKRSPVASSIAGMVGQGAEDILLTPARWGAALAGAVSGGISGAGEADDGDRLEGGLDSAGAGAVFGKGGELLARGAGAVAGGAKRLSGTLQGLTNEGRNAALGGTAGDFQKLARTKGLDYVEGGPGEAAQRLGLTNRFFPVSPSGYARRAQAAMTREGAAEGAALDDAGESIATYTPVDELAGGLRRRGAGQRDGTPEGLAEDSRLNDMADVLLRERGMPELQPTPGVDPMDALYGGFGGELPQPGFAPTGRTAPGSAGMFSPAELNAQKSTYYDRGYKQQGISDNTSQLGAETNRIAGSEARQQLLAALDYAPPGVKPRYEAAAQNYGEAATIHDMARNKAAGMQAQPGGGFFSTLMSPATRALQRFGPDFAANMGQLGADAAGGLGNASGLAAQGFNGLSRAGGAMGTQAAGADDNPPGDPLASGRGYLLPQVVADLARTNPQSLGPYYQQIAQAMHDQSNAGQLNALLERLERDPQWSQYYLPQLRARTAEGAGY